MIADGFKPVAKAAHDVNSMPIPVQDEEEIDPCLEECLDKEFHLISADEIQRNFDGCRDRGQYDEQLSCNRYDGNSPGFCIINICPCKGLQEVIPFAVLISIDMHFILKCRLIAAGSNVSAVYPHEDGTKVQRKTDAEDNIPCRLIRRLDIEYDHKPCECDHDG